MVWVWGIRVLWWMSLRISQQQICTLPPYCVSIWWPLRLWRLRWTLLCRALLLPRLWCPWGEGVQLSTYCNCTAYLCFDFGQACFHDLEVDRVGSCLCLWGPGRVRFVWVMQVSWNGSDCETVIPYVDKHWNIIPFTVKCLLTPPPQPMALADFCTTYVKKNFCIPLAWSTFVIKYAWPSLGRGCYKTHSNFRS